MLIILDTSSIVPDFFFQSAVLNALLNESYRVPASIGISEVVRAELLVNYRRRLEKLRDELDKFRGCFEGNKQSLLNEDGVRLMCAEYEKWMGHHLRLKGEKLPVPSIGHIEIIEKMSLLRRPFQEGGKGYKDFLIWRSVIDWLDANQGHVCFVSENKKDFSDSSGRLHPDLLSDLDHHSIERGRVHYYESAKDCYDKEVAPFLEKLNHIASELTKGQYEKLDLEKWVYQNWDVVLSELNLDPEEFIPDHEFVEAKIISLRKAQLSDVFQVTRIGSSEFAVDFFIRATLDIELARSSHSTSQRTSWREIDQISQMFEINLVLLFDEASKAVTSYEVADFSAVIGG